MKPQTTFTRQGTLGALMALLVFVIGGTAQGQGQRSADELLDILGLSGKSLNQEDGGGGTPFILANAELEAGVEEDAADADAEEEVVPVVTGQFMDIVRAAADLTAYTRQGPIVTLREALRLTLYNQPVIQLAGEDLAQAEAQARAAAAVFDVGLFAEFGKRETYRPKTDAAINQQIQQKRTLNILADSLGKVADGLESGADEVTITFEGAGGKQVTETIPLDFNGLAQNFGGLQVNGQSITADANTLALLQQTGSADPDLANPTAIPAGFDSLADYQASIIQTQVDAFRLGQEVTQTAADDIKITTTERFGTMTYKFGATKLFRNGTAVMPRVEFDQTSSGSNFARGILEFGVPLLKDRGARVENAAEESSLIDWEASRMQYYHTYSTVLLNTVIAYWELVAAQQNVELLSNSEKITGVFVEVTRAKVQEEEQTAGDLSQALSNYASAKATRIAAEFRLLEARRNLAFSMGLSGANLLEAPFAVGNLPQPIDFAQVDAVPFDAVIDLAATHRQDLAAQRTLAQSRKVLTDALRDNLGPSLNVNFGFDASARNTGTASEDYFGTLTDNKVGLGAFGTVRLDWPVQDNAAKSQYYLAATDHRRQETLLFDLERQIQNDAVLSLEQIRSTNLQVDAFLQALAQSEKSLIAEQVRSEEGEGTLLDLIQVQNQFTQIAGSAIFAQQAHASAIAKFRFDTGTMISGGSGLPGDESTVDLQDLTKLPDFSEFTGIGDLTVSGIPKDLLNQMKKAGYQVGLGGVQEPPKPLFLRGRSPTGEENNSMPLLKRHAANDHGPYASELAAPGDNIVGPHGTAEEELVLPNVDPPVNDNTPSAEVQPMVESAPAVNGAPKPLFKRLFGN